MILQQATGHREEINVGNAVNNRPRRPGKTRRENGVLGRSKKGMTGRKEFAKANGDFSVGGVTGSIAAMGHA